MKIGIDAGCLVIKNENQKTGLYRLAVNFLTALSKLDQENQYLLFSFAPIEKGLLRRLGPNFKNVVAWPSLGWLYFALPFFLLISKVDVFLSLSQSLPFFCFCSKVVVFHDLAFEKSPPLLLKKRSFEIKKD